jgi:hypothetical protein
VASSRLRPPGLALLPGFQAYGQPSHEQLARATDTSVRTVPRALLALRAIGLLSDGKERVMPIKQPEQVRHIQRAMAAIAARAGCSVKTLYQWDQEANLEKPH